MRNRENLIEAVCQYVRNGTHELDDYIESLNVSDDDAETLRQDDSNAEISREVEMLFEKYGENHIYVLARRLEEYV